jgi:hypothetical protein
MQTITCLDEGAIFGGGAAVLGESSLLHRLRVISDTPVQCYLLPVDIFTAHAAPAMIK